MFDHQAVSVFTIPKVIVEAQADFNCEDQIEYLAKVSNPGSQAMMEAGSSGQLTNYLMNNSHWSPLEMVNIVLKVVTTRDISHQLIRHPTIRFQEFSQRYAEVDTASFIVLNGRTQDTKNRQNSIDNLSKDDQDWWIGAQEMVATYAEHIYKKALERGIAKECARRILPEGMTPTTLYAVANVRTFYHYVKLRSSNGTQLEHMDIAKKVNVCLNEYLPNIFPLEKDTAC